MPKKKYNLKNIRANTERNFLATNTTLPQHKSKLK